MRRPPCAPRVLALGLRGPALLLGSLPSATASGWDTPWYLAELGAVGYVPFVVMLSLVVWLAGAGQLAALAARPLRAVSGRGRAPAARPDPATSSARAVLGRESRRRADRRRSKLGGLDARPLRILGTLLIVAGVLTLAWALVVWQWQDPFTALYTKWQQQQLASQYDKRIASRPHGSIRRIDTRGRARASDRDAGRASYRATLEARAGDRPHRSCRGSA